MGEKFDWKTAWYGDYATLCDRLESADAALRRAEAEVARLTALLAKADVTALERAAGIAAVCHRHVEYGPTFAPSQDIHHDTPAEIRDLDPAEIVKEWKESKNA